MIRLHLPIPLAFSFLTVAACSSGSSTNGPSPTGEVPAGTVFAAVEDDGTIVAIDERTGAKLSVVDVSEDSMGSTIKFDVHNVQGAPDGRMVWVTAMPSMDGSSTMTMPDELIGIDASSFAVMKRIPLGEKQHPAHVVLDGDTAYVTAYDANALLVVDTVAGKVTRSVPLPDGASPHGERLTPDRRTVVVAGMGTGAIVLVDTTTFDVTSIPVPAPAVQAAVLPDGSAAFVSLYDTKQIARLDLHTHALSLFDLPADSQGPVQIYPTPDSSSLWVADQGNLEGRPAGTHLYRLDTSSGAVTLTANVGNAPHGVVLNADATRVWTTLSADGTVQEIDGKTGAILATTPVGHSPNGITCVHTDGAMP